MNTEKAIEFMNKNILDFKKRTDNEEVFDKNECEKFIKKAKEVVFLLKRGEIDRKIIDKMKNEKYDVWISLPRRFTNIPKFVRDVEKEVIK